MKVLSKVPPAQLGALALIIVAALGYLGYSKYYTPAEAERATAATELETAQSSLQAAQDDLSRLEAQGPDFAQLAKVGVSNVAVPAKANASDAFLELTRLGRKSGVKLLEHQIAAAATSGDADTSTGARSMDITLEGFARYPDLMDYVDRIESTVRIEDGEAYVRGRLFAVQNLEISPADDDSNSFDSSSAGPLEVPVDGSTYVKFTLLVQIYTRSSPEPTGGAPIDPNADAAAAPGGTTPSGGSSGTTPPPSGSAPEPAPGADGSSAPVGTS